VPRDNAPSPRTSAWIGNAYNAEPAQTGNLWGSGGYRLSTGMDRSLAARAGPEHTGQSDRKTRPADLRFTSARVFGVVVLPVGIAEPQGNAQR